MTAAIEERIDQCGLMRRLEKRRRQPRRAVAVQELRCLFVIAGPEDIARRSAWSFIKGDQLREVLSQERGVPEASRRNGDVLTSGASPG